MTSPSAAAVPRLAFDSRRNLAALGIAAVFSALALGVYALVWPTPFTINTVTLTTFVFWIGYSIAWLVLTHLVFGRLAQAELRRVLEATTSRAAKSPTVNVQWSILAMAAVGLVLLLPGLLSDVLANGLSLLVVLSAWLVTVSTYAVHYARLNTLDEAIALPGNADGPVFFDYYYLAAQIATTFSSSDVTILTTHARAVVTGQTYISFAFSTFIIALLITVLFLG